MEKQLVIVQAAFSIDERVIVLRKLKSYTRIWSVEKVIYAINDFRLPFPVTFNQMSWFVISLLMVMLLGNLPPLSLINGALLKYVGIPVGLTWFMSQKTLDVKKPYSFLKSAVTYWFRSKVTYAGKPVKLQHVKVNENLTAVRSEIHALSD